MGAVVDAPAGFREMCERDRALCVAASPRSNAPRKESDAVISAPATAHEPRRFEFALAGGFSFGMRNYACSIAGHSTEDTNPPAYLMPAQYFLGAANICWAPHALEPAATNPIFDDEITATPTRKAKLADSALLKRVNLNVNRVVRQRTDAEIYGASEFWTPSGSNRGARGDCEDIAIEKRLQLVAAGFDPARLAYATVYTRRTGLHTVLIARTDAGDMVLDSWSNRIQPWQRTPYSWVNVQSMRDPLVWRQPNS